MISASDINRIIGIHESFELPEKLSSILKNKSVREKTFDEFLAITDDLSSDWFTNYFQEEQSNRDKFKQDFTPACVTDILRNIVPGFQYCADICAGTGGLTIAMYNKNPEGFFYCAELSNRAFPLLLFNLAIRNMNAYVINQDVLTLETSVVYKLTKGGKYSAIEQIEKAPAVMADVVVMNPPYSVKHKWDEKENDPRFTGFGYPPNNFSDWAFVMHGFKMLKDGGTLAAILPHGVLFRGGREAQIRQAFLVKKHIDGIIGLPEKLFLNTGIPVAVMILKKSAANDVFFIDASQEFEQQGKQNNISQNSISRIVELYQSHRETARLSHIASYQEIADNNYNLNIPRYVDTYVPPPVPDIIAVAKEIIEINREIEDTSETLLNCMRELTGGSDFKKALSILEEGIKGGEIRTL